MQNKEKKLQIATVFSGIGAFEHALKRMNIPNDINNNVSIESNISNQSKQYEVTNQFLNQCKIYLTPGNFERIVNTFQDYKDGLINDDEIVSRTRSILQGNNKLLNLFETLFLLE